MVLFIAACSFSPYCALGFHKALCVPLITLCVCVCLSHAKARIQCLGGILITRQAKDQGSACKTFARTVSAISQPLRKQGPGRGFLRIQGCRLSRCRVAAQVRVLLGRGEGTQEPGYKEGRLLAGAWPPQGRGLNQGWMPPGAWPSGGPSDAPGGSGHVPGPLIKGGARGGA